MGCSSSRGTLTPEEAAITNGESYLHYSTLDIKHVYIELCRLSKDKKTVELKKFKKLAQDLNLGFGAGKVDPLVESFYQRINLDGVFQLRHLMIIALLLSKGSIKLKAKILYECYDTDNSRTIDKSVLALIFDDLCLVAADELPKLVRPDDPNNVSHQDMRNYLEKIMLGKEKWKIDFIHQVSKGNNEVTEVDFIIWFKLNENSGWLDSKGLRENLKKLGKKVKKAQKNYSEDTEHHDN